MFTVRKLNYESVIVVLFSILPLVDSINGILIRQGLPSVAILYKAMLVGILLIPILNRRIANKNVFGFVVAFIVYLIFTMILNYAIIGESFIELSYPIKIIFNVVTFALLWSNIDCNILNGNTIYKIFDYNTYIMLLCMFVPYVLGLGYTIYSGGIGYKAFFYSNNELNATLIILFYFCLFKVSQKFNLMSLIQLGGIFVCVLMMNTKSSIIVCGVGVLVFLLKCLKKIDGRIKTIILIIGVGGIYLVKDFILEQISSFMSRQTGLLNVYGGDLLATLTSGRLYFIEDAVEELVSRPLYVVQVLFGNGFISSVLTEMDFVDIFFYMGIVGFIMVVIGLVWIYRKSIPNFRQDRNGVRKIGFLLIIAFSFIAGHVLFMATSGCYFVLYCCFIMTYSIETVEKIDEKNV